MTGGNRQGKPGREEGTGREAAKGQLTEATERKSQGSGDGRAERGPGTTGGKAQDGSAVEETPEETRRMRPNHLGHLSPRECHKKQTQTPFFSVSLKTKFILPSKHGP